MTVRIPPVRGVLVPLVLAGLAAAAASVIPWLLAGERPSRDELAAAAASLHPAPEQIDGPGGVATFSRFYPYGGFHEFREPGAGVREATVRGAAARGWRVVEEHRGTVVLRRAGMVAYVHPGSVEVWPAPPRAQGVATLAGGALGAAAAWVVRGRRPRPAVVGALATALVPLALGASLAVQDAARRTPPPAPYADHVGTALLFGWPLIGVVAVVVLLVLGARRRRSHRPS